MSAAIPLFDNTTRKNPLNWSRQMVQPNPVVKDAYPISGFTMFNFYQCYSSQPVFDGILQYLTLHYLNAATTNILHDQQFTEVPSIWLDEIVKLVQPINPDTGLNLAGNGPCTGKSGA